MGRSASLTQSTAEPPVIVVRGLTTTFRISFRHDWLRWSVAARMRRSGRHIAANSAASGVFFVTSSLTWTTVTSSAALRSAPIVTAAPLVTAPTVAVVEAGERLAKTQPGGRMATPLLCILDEAANVCRWKDLPDLYSHYGSRGIPIMSIFRSWSQGVDVFPLAGMRKLFSAANEVVYLGGVKEIEFMREMSDLIGDYDHETISYSMNKGVRSTNVQNNRRRIRRPVGGRGAAPWTRDPDRAGSAVVDGEDGALVRGLGR